MPKLSKKIKKLEQIMNANGYKLVLGKGSFQSGFCIMNEQKIIVVNSFFDKKDTEYVLNSIINKLNFHQKNNKDKAIEK